MTRKAGGQLGREKGLGDLLVKEELITREVLEEAREEEKERGIPWLKTLLYKEIVVPKQVTDLLKTSKPKKVRGGNLGKVLLEMRVITKSQLNNALDDQRRTGRYLGRILLDQGVIKQKDYTMALCRLHDLPFVDLSRQKPQKAAVELLPENVARKNRMIPFRLEDDELSVALGDPTAVGSLDMVRPFLKGLELVPHLAVEEDLNNAIAKFYDSDPEAKQQPKKKTAGKKKVSTPEISTRDSVKEQMNIQAAADSRRFEELSRAADNVPVVKLVATLIEGAINARATDIHLDPHEPEMRVRYRIDGVLHDVMTIPSHIQPAVISRLKILADMDITETRHPQDGHISFLVEGDSFDLRVASLPTNLGERLVLRLLDPTSVMTGMNELGMEKDDLKVFEKILGAPFGMILLVGPTGSGKTTTLYAALNQLNILTDSIVTLEDPVEYRLSGINQVQIDTSIGVTFATTLRAVLRQDPDVILVGEIRDVDTAEIAVRAAMTGHLLFSTLHSNNAPEAITTLRNMGIPPFLVSASLLGVISQRLVRVICLECKESYKPSKAILKSVGLPESTKELYTGTGCDHCYHTGYRGRAGVFEILVVDDKIRKMIEAGDSIDKIASAAKMRPMASDIRRKVKAGITTVEEYMGLIGL